MNNITITAVSSIWLHTSCGAIDFAYVIAYNSAGYWVGVLQGDKCVIVGAHLDTQAVAEQHMRKMVREMGGMLFEAKGSVHTVLHYTALNTPWAWFEEGVWDDKRNLERSASANDAGLYQAGGPGNHSGLRRNQHVEAEDGPGCLPWTERVCPEYGGPVRFSSRGQCEESCSGGSSEESNLLVTGKWYQLDERTWILRDGTDTLGSVVRLSVGYFRYAAWAGYRERGVFRTKLGAMRAVRFRLKMNSTFRSLYLVDD